jgi:hypothetical protein
MVGLTDPDPDIPVAKADPGGVDGVPVDLQDPGVPLGVDPGLCAARAPLLEDRLGDWCDCVRSNRVQSFAAGQADAVLCASIFDLYGR